MDKILTWNNSSQQSLNIEDCSLWEKLRRVQELYNILRENFYVEWNEKVGYYLMHDCDNEWAVLVNILENPEYAETFKDAIIKMYYILLFVYSYVLGKVSYSELEEEYSISQIVHLLQHFPSLVTKSGSESRAKIVVLSETNEEDLWNENDMKVRVALPYIYRIIYNCIRNSVTHWWAEEIYISVFIENERLMIDVIDDGEWISRDLLEVDAQTGMEKMFSSGISQGSSGIGLNGGEVFQTAWIEVCANNLRSWFLPHFHDVQYSWGARIGISIPLLQQVETQQELKNRVDESRSDTSQKIVNLI